MGIFKRPDSPDFWMLIERPGRKSIRKTTGVPKDGGSAKQNQELKRQAEEIYAAAKVVHARRRFKLAVETEGRSFREHRDWYEKNVTVHKLGRKSEMSTLKQLGVYFDKLELTEIDKDIVSEWRTWRRQKVKASSVNREEEVLKHMLNLAVPKYLESNPIAGMKRLRQEDTETRIFTPDEEDRLLEATTDPFESAIFLCGFDALMRLGSIVNLNRAQDHQLYLTLLNAKTGKYKVPVSTRLRKALNEVPIEGTRYFERYWPNAENKVQRRFVKLCARAQVTAHRKAGGVTFHSLRHTGASRMLARGVDVKTVMMIGGWTNLKILERYLHPTEESKLLAVNTIGKRDKEEE